MRVAARVLMCRLHSNGLRNWAGSGISQFSVVEVAAGCRRKLWLMGEGGLSVGGLDNTHAVWMPWRKG